MRGDQQLSLRHGGGAVMRALIVALVLLAATAARGAEYPKEQRCTDLGAACACSEPLNSPEANWSIVAGEGDPGDTEGASSKPCEPGPGGVEFIETASGNLATELSTPTETGMPAGNAVDVVMQFQPAVNVSGYGWMPTNIVDSATRRVCWRHYEQFSDDWTVCNAKHTSMGWGGAIFSILHHEGEPDPWNDGVLQLNTTNNGQHPDRCDDSGSDEYPCTSVVDTYPSVFDCQFGDNRWCGIEICVAGNVEAGTGLTLDYYTWVTDSSDSFTKEDLTFGVGGTFESQQYFLNVYMQNSPGTCTTGQTRRWSHAMIAEWETDNGLRIGPASEVEGSGITTIKAPFLLP